MIQNHARFLLVGLRSAWYFNLNEVNENIIGWIIIVVDGYVYFLDFANIIWFELEESFSIRVVLWLSQLIVV